MSECVLILAPEVCRAGGVQSFSRAFINACSDLLGPERLVVFGRNDRTNDLRRLRPHDRGVLGLAGRVPSRLRRLAAPWAVARLCSRHRPRAVLCTHPHLAQFAVGRGIPTLVVCHGVDAWNLNSRSARALDRSDRVLAVSRFTRDRLIAQIPALADRLRVFPNTFDTERFQWSGPDYSLRSELGIPPDARVLLAVTRLEPTERPKGYDDVIRALSRVSAVHPRVMFVLAGAGSEIVRVKALAESLGVGDRVLLPGFVDESDLPRLYRTADAFVMPSRKEGFGIVFIEAVACGIPVIAGNADGSVDALLDGRVGRLVTLGDPTELDRAIIEELQRDPIERSATTRRNAALVANEFGPDRFRERLKGHLDDLGIRASQWSDDTGDKLSLHSDSAEPVRKAPEQRT